MQPLQLRRIRFSKEADNWLRVLKMRTGLTPNIISRLALCLSLAEPGKPTNDEYPEDSDREMNRITLLGDHDFVFVTLVRQRILSDGYAADEPVDTHFRAHMHRGIRLVAARCKGLVELGELMAL